jgi:DNA modification methylase
MTTPSPAAAEYVTVASLRPWVKNPRKNDPAVAAVADSIKRFGFGSPIIARRENGEIIAGHTRLKAAIRLGLAEVPVRYLDLSEAEAHALALADNKVGELAEWDDAALADVLRDLTADDVSMDGLGFTAEEIAVLIGSGDDPSGTPDPGAPEVEEGPAHSVAGEVYELGPHRLLCGDATVASNVATLLSGALARLAFLDPPYGVNFQSGMSQGGTATRFSPLMNDDKILTVAPVVWPSMADDSAAFVWTSHHVYPVWRDQFAEHYKQTIIWHKPGGGMGDLEGQYANDYEIALFCVKGRPTFRGKRGMAVWTVGKDGVMDYEHPTQKPVDLAERAIADFSDPGDIVLDLFGGSGTSLIGCARTKRISRMAEIDPHYCDVIRRRWTRWAKEAGQEPGTGALDG